MQCSCAIFSSVACPGRQYFCTLFHESTLEIISKFAMAKAAFNKKRALFSSIVDLKLR